MVCNPSHNTSILYRHMGVTYNNGRAKVVGDNMELFNSNIDFIELQMQDGLTLTRFI
ncbi:MAG: hypothetical protein M3297_06380 [Thermoproteota archaeon]|nr:hypothetical protein [Thermoproteota archaeon]